MATVSCPSCHHTFEAPASGPAVCPTCGASVPAPSDAPSAAPASIAASILSYAAPEELGEGKLRPYLPRIVDSILDKVRRIIDEKFFGSLGQLALLGGELMVYIALAILFLAFFISGIEVKSFMPVLVGAGIVVLGILALYVALQMIIAGFKILRASPTRLNNGLYLNCFVLLYLVIAVGLFVIPFTGFGELVVGAGAPALVIYAACWIMSLLFLLEALLALKPSVLNIEINPSASAGETYLGLISFFLKAALALMPVYLLLGAFITMITSFVGIGYMLFSKAELVGARTLLLAMAFMIYTLALPILITLLFLFYYLVVDLCQAILAIPRLKKD